MNHQPCSVLMPLYNGSSFLGKSIPSILLGMREIDELLIINDGSEDIKISNLLKIESMDQRIRIVNKKHSGLVETLNYGIELCANEFIARADIDDTYSQDRIVKQIDFMSKNPLCAAVFSDYQIRSLNGRDLGLIPTAISPILTRFSLINPQRVPHPSVMFRKSAVMDVGLYSCEDFPAEDLSLWIKLSRHYEIASIPEPLLNYTLHKGNITSNNKKLMLEKNKLLLHAFSKTLSIDEIMNDAEKTFKLYDSVDNSLERKILFFRDIIKYAKSKKKIRLSLLFNHSHLVSQILELRIARTYMNLKNDQKKRMSN